MARKEFSYHGKSLEELKALDLKQLSALFPSRIRRSIERGWTEQQKILLNNLETNDTVKTHCRDMVVLPSMVGKTINVYNGNGFVGVHVSEQMIGHYLGEFALTRKRVGHSAPGVGATRSSASMSVR